tara:strand:+ start:8404 stop:12000 length:3597 start_codon:yes stop_codon:yes gene_type:complete
MFEKILIANRGEIAVRILRSAQSLGIKTVAIYSEADRNAPHVSLADEAVCVGGAPVSESYLRIDEIVRVCKELGVQGVHPGYGLLSESAVFAEALAEAEVEFIGPRPEHLREFGLKHTARDLAVKSGVPLVPGTGLLSDLSTALEQAGQIGYPIMLKSTAGGGGIGMQLCRSAKDLEEAFSRVQRLGVSNFGEGGVFLEKYIERARHLEVQVFGDGVGGAVSLGVRDCSAQRRNQKVIEETPAAGVSAKVLQGLEDSAIRLARSVHYRSAGTVEFIYDEKDGQYYFLEVNTRLQVEHGVTEEVQGVDLVDWMIQLASGDLTDLSLPTDRPGGHSIEARIYAENPAQNFQPSSGLMNHVRFPDGVRCDHWISSGSEISPFYDPLLAKIIVHEDTREKALIALEKALRETELYGIETNLDYLAALAGSALLQENRMTTRSLEDFTYDSRMVDVLKGGTQTTVQDYPGRLGFWDVGVPPSGPMDPLSFRLGNRLLGNSSEAAGLEITAQGPKIRFHSETTIVLTGAVTQATLDGEEVPFWTPIPVAADSVLDVGQVVDAGMRAYLCFAGGLDIASYLGSKSTFTLGQFGGHAGRALQVGDVLRLTANQEVTPKDALAGTLRPNWGHHWEVKVLYGPHGAPDFFTPKDIDVFFKTDWEVHFNSARTGVRLMGPKPEWARTDGGEAGLHPSNIHDNAYAVGAVDFTGDMPVILGPDGPSLGGFVCPVTIAAVDIWKMGQFKPGDTIRFTCISQSEATDYLREQEDMIATLEGTTTEEFGGYSRVPEPEEAILFTEGEGEQRWVVRQSGDDNILIEFGDPVLSLRIRFAVHVFYEELQSKRLPGVVDLTPGIRSLQVHFDNRILQRDQVLAWIRDCRESLGDMKRQSVPSRIVHLPLSWDDPATKEAIVRYENSVRSDAPWCPDNLEFIRRMNGLDSVEDVKKVVFDASYVVLGLGDVYLGAPVATPLDPRHRLVTTKYNPARTWTPENAVGIGGTYLCVYGMEGPGGYQFVGRTLQMWNRYGSNSSFAGDTRWLLRFFDQIRFFPVSAEELLQIREDFPEGRYPIRIEESTFSLADHEAMLERESSSIAEFKRRQETAFHEERSRWNEADQKSETQETQSTEDSDTDLDEGVERVESPVAGSLYKVLVGEGDSVEEGQIVAIIESMKMEISVTSPIGGQVVKILRKEGQGVKPAEVLLGIDPT